MELIYYELKLFQCFKTVKDLIDTYVWALSVNAVYEQLDGSHVITSH